MSENGEKKEDIVRVLRVVEYTGRRGDVERAVSSAVHGQKIVHPHLTIRAATIGSYPEILDAAVMIQRITGPEDQTVRCGGLGCLTYDCEHWGKGPKECALGSVCKKGLKL